MNKTKAETKSSISVKKRKSSTKKSASGGPVEKSDEEIKASSEFISLKAGGSKFSVGEDEKINEDLENADSIEDIPISSTKHEDYDRVSQSSANSVSSRATSPQLIHRRQGLLEKSDLEVWWLDSPKWRRFLPIMCATIFIIGCCQLTAALYFLFDGFIGGSEIPDPYICQTESCKSVGNFIERSLDETINPCDNFYQFVCGNYTRATGSEVEAPAKVNFAVARLEFNQKSLIGSILHKNSDIQGKIIPFYKSCMNVGLRRKTDLTVLVETLFNILKPAFINIEKFDKLVLMAQVAQFTGHFGLFRVKFLNEGQMNKSIVLLPPDNYSEFTGFNIHDDNDTKTMEFTAALKHTFSILWEEFRKYNYNKNPLNITSEKAADYAIIVLRVINNASSGRGPIPIEINDNPAHANMHVRAILDNFLFPNKSQRNTTADDYNIISSPIRGQEFEADHVYDQILRIRESVNGIGSTTVTKESHQAFVSFWIYNLLWGFSTHVEASLYKKLKFTTLFENSPPERNLTTDIFCFESLIDKLGAHVIEALLQQNKKVYEASTVWLVEMFHRTYRAQSKMFRIINSHFLYPDQAFITKAFTFIQAGVTPMYPFPQHLHQRELLLKMDYIFNAFEPTKIYLENIMGARKALLKGIVELWKNHSYDQDFKYIALGRMGEQTHDGVRYQNKIYFPVTTLDLPYIGNDLRVLDHAGTGLHIAKSLLKLWLMDRENPEAFLRFEKPEELHRYYNAPIYRPLKQQFKLCSSQFSNSQPTSTNLDDLLASPLINALAIKLAFEVYKNPSQYESFVGKKSRKIEQNIRFIYDQTDNQNPEPKYYKIGEGQPTNNDIINASYITLPSREEKKSKYDLFSSLFTKFKRNYTKLPGRLVKFTTDQLFFISAVGSKCFETSKSQSYMDQMNSALSEVEEFGEAFNCPLGSPLNKIDKCLQI